MRFSKMHFRNVKRALLIFTPSEMHLQRVKKTKILKNSLRQEVANSPQPFSSSCSSLLFLHSMGGVHTYIRCIHLDNQPSASVLSRFFSFSDK